MRDRRPDLVLRRMRVLTWAAARTDWDEADIVVDRGRIVEVGPGVADTIPYDPSAAPISSPCRVSSTAASTRRATS